MGCVHCKGQMQRATAPFRVDRNGYHVSWDAVPAWVCGQCGEPYFERDEVQRIQRALSALDALQSRHEAGWRPRTSRR